MIQLSCDSMLYGWPPLTQHPAPPLTTASPAPAARWPPTQSPPIPGASLVPMQGPAWRTLLWRRESGQPTAVEGAEWLPPHKAIRLAESLSTTPPMVSPPLGPWVLQRLWQLATRIAATIMKPWLCNYDRLLESTAIAKLCSVTIPRTNSEQSPLHEFTH